MGRHTKAALESQPHLNEGLWKANDSDVPVDAREPPLVLVFEIRPVRPPHHLRGTVKDQTISTGLLWAKQLAQLALQVPLSSLCNRPSTALLALP